MVVMVRCHRHAQLTIVIGSPCPNAAIFCQSCTATGCTISTLLPCVCVVSRMCFSRYSCAITLCVAVEIERICSTCDVRQQQPPAPAAAVCHASSKNVWREAKADGDVQERFWAVQGLVVYNYTAAQCLRQRVSDPSPLRLL